ncbi:thermonuclease family protein [Sutcliffiella cohnii]|uniref:TNase-like domain-containing protein n=1 Tax=Sutcliffiella cohnii TaxID=33932 RepID=A0A223KTL4_9BACI|nr:thermonuclease family protein [Sutcliffiella cohnii]AST92663.1 hypothetical protein BC6307_15855 [Sutcliffiella cohnii]MED4016444.1 thermonuclease family protein [Sutcliffiella cohnii]
MRKLHKIILLLLLITLLAACSLNNSEEAQRIEVPVTSVIDGDTIRVLINGKEERVRFLLIDTPEMNHSTPEEPQPFAVEATEYVEKLLEGGTVELEFDISERDRYGRLLAYLYVEDKNIQEELLRNGLARVAYIYEPNTKYVDHFQSIQKEAQKQEIGIWSIENYASENGFYLE